MLRFLRDKKAQNTMEYAIMIVVIIGVFTAMQMYVRRGMSGRIKAGVDNIPAAVLGQAVGVSANILGDAAQYEPYYTALGTSNLTTASSEGTETGTISQTGGKRGLTGATTRRTGTQTTVGTSQAD